MIPIHEQYSAFGSVQWLDSKAGQPGEKWELYVTKDSAESVELKGGDHLLVNEKVVLSVKDLQIYPLQFNSDHTMGYYATNVVGFSPDQKKLIFLGNKRDPSLPFALITVNFKSGELNTIPFSRNETRLHEPYNFKRKWFDQYFQWVTNEKGYYFIPEVSGNIEGL